MEEQQTNKKDVNIENKNFEVKKKTPWFYAVKESVSLEINLPVVTRVRNRLDELHRISRAKHIKIQSGNMRKIETQPPQVHLCDLRSTVVNGEGQITYKVYKTDAKGNKVKGPITKGMSSMGREVDLNTSYLIEKEVVEIIKLRAPLQQEVYEVSN